MYKRLKVKQDRFAIMQSQRGGSKAAIGWCIEGDILFGNNSDYRINKKSK